MEIKLKHKELIVHALKDGIKQSSEWLFPCPGTDRCNEFGHDCTECKKSWLEETVTFMEEFE